MAEIEYNPSPKSLNGAQFSQLPLFNMKPQARQRWPRGYTPERMHAVGEQMAGADIQSGNTAPPISASPFKSVNAFITPRVIGRMGQGDMAKYQAVQGVKRKMTMQTRNALTDIVARSTVPAEHLENLPPITVTPKLSELGAGGMYARPGQRGAEEGLIALNPTIHTKREDYEKSALHELGHHRDFQESPRAFVRRSNAGWEEGGSTVSPGLEGYAEGYAHGHFRPRQGQKRPQHVSYQQLHDVPEFQDRFREASGGLEVADVDWTSRTVGQWERQQKRLQGVPRFHQPPLPGMGRF